MDVADTWFAVYDRQVGWCGERKMAGGGGKKRGKEGRERLKKL